MLRSEWVKANLVSCGDLHDVKRAWETSRPADTDGDMKKILSMDVPVNEFLPLHFELKAPILIREVICSFRNHNVWARSSRVDDLRTWEVWHGIDDQTMSHCRSAYARMEDEMHGVHQDDFRRHLPLAYMTTFSFMMNFRDLVKFIIALRKEELDLFNEVADELVLAIWRKYPTLSQWLGSAVEEKWYKAAPLNSYPTSMMFKSTKVCDFVYIEAQIKLNLRAQLIRHRSLMVKDRLRDFFKPEMMAATMADNIAVSLIMPVDFAEDLVRKRSCWIAQTDLWEPIVSQLLEILGKDKVMLPCDDGKCRFIRDNDLRKMGHDPSPPCPVLAKIDKEKMSPVHAEEAKNYAARRPHTNFWMKVIEDA
jgi:hypothetical protein